MSTFVSKRYIFFMLFIVFISLNGSAYAAGTLILKSAGNARKLPENMMGFNAATALYEDLLDDPAKLPLTKLMAPSILRFPGGSIANYYHWENGKIEIPVYKNSSAYTRMLSRVAQYTRNRHPAGVFIEKFTGFSQKAGAEVLLVPNLESSSISRQAAWFSSMKEQGIVPKYIELGNEFWVAMLNDPNVIKKFPDVKSAMKTMQEYLAGIKPYLPQEARIAVQGAASYYYAPRPSGGLNSMIRRMFDWDRDLENESWFDAITIHLYPRPELVVGRGQASNLGAHVDKVFPALMARTDSGFDRTVEAIKRRNPGKEIWVTEWNPNHVQFSLENSAPGFSGMMIHMTARMFLAFLRHPEVTMSTFHMLSFTGQVNSVFSPDGTGYAMAGPGVAVKWFHEAAYGPASYDRVLVQGAKRLQGRGLIARESYSDVEAGLFEREGRSTLIVQNAGLSAVRLDISALLGSQKAKKIEVFSTPDLMKNYVRSPEVTNITPTSLFQAPPLSLTRVLW